MLYETAYLEPQLFIKTFFLVKLIDSNSLALYHHIYGFSVKLGTALLAEELYKCYSLYTM